MPRALAVATVTVAPADEAAYLEGAAELAAELGRRGQHLWVFRHPSEPSRFLEFRESGDASAHVDVAPTPTEASLRRALHRLGTYESVTAAPWLEVSLAPHAPTDRPA